MRVPSRPEFGAYAVIQATVLVVCGGSLLAFGGPARAAVYIGLVAVAALVAAHYAFAPGRSEVVAVAAYFLFATGAIIAAVPIIWLAPDVLYHLRGLTFAERVIAATLFAVFIVAVGVTILAWARVAYGRLPLGWYTPLSFRGKDVRGNVAHIRDRRRGRG